MSYLKDFVVSGKVTLVSCYLLKQSNGVRCKYNIFRAIQTSFSITN